MPYLWYTCTTAPGLPSPQWTCPFIAACVPRQGHRATTRVIPTRLPAPPRTGPPAWAYAYAYANAYAHTHNAIVMGAHRDNDNHIHIVIMIIIFTFIYAHCRITTRVPGGATNEWAATDKGSLTIVVAILGPGSPLAEYTGQNARVCASALQNVTLYKGAPQGKIMLWECV